jgi:hypothetical protein
MLKNITKEEENFKQEHCKKPLHNRVLYTDIEIWKFTDKGKNTENYMKYILMTKSPLDISIDTYQSFQQYSSGIYDSYGDDEEKLGR